MNCYQVWAGPDHIVWQWWRWQWSQFNWRFRTLREFITSQIFNTFAENLTTRILSIKTLRIVCDHGHWNNTWHSKGCFTLDICARDIAIKRNFFFKILKWNFKIFRIVQKNIFNKHRKRNIGWKMSFYLNIFLSQYCIVCKNV